MRHVVAVMAVKLSFQFSSNINLAKSDTTLWNHTGAAGCLIIDLHVQVCQLDFSVILRLNCTHNTHTQEITLCSFSCEWHECDGLFFSDWSPLCTADCWSVIVCEDVCLDTALFTWCYHQQTLCGRHRTIHWVNRWLWLIYFTWKNCKRAALLLDIMKRKCL